MKMSVKKAVACTALAAAMTASAAVSAGAVDYASKPSYTPPASQSSSPVYSAPGRSSMTAISKIAESDIAGAITSSLKTKHDAVVYVSGANISLNADAVAAIANAEAPITFSAGKYSVTIDPSTVFDVKDINIAMALYVGENSTNVNGVSVPASSIMILITSLMIAIIFIARTITPIMPPMIASNANTPMLPAIPKLRGISNTSIFCMPKGKPPIIQNRNQFIPFSPRHIQ